MVRAGQLLLCVPIGHRACACMGREHAHACGACALHAYAFDRRLLPCLPRLCLITREDLTAVLHHSLTGLDAHLATSMSGSVQLRECDSV